MLAAVEYDGTDFAGFQLQAGRDDAPAPRTVQGELERAIAACTGESARVVGSGRTDAGVHARRQAIHFDSESRLAAEPSRFVGALNAHLPRDVKFRSLQPVPAAFHARYSARSRTYSYRVLSGGAPSPLHRRQAHHVRAALDVERMGEGAAHLVGTHDFVAFAGKEGPGTTVRRVFRAQVRQTWAEAPLIWHTLGSESLATGVAARDTGASGLVEIEVEATGFLRHMMRRLAGALIRVGDGRLTPSDIADILASRDKALAGPTAPANGLCLERVTYDEESLRLS